MKSLLTIGVNDLASQSPAVASQAYGWNPSEVFAQSNKKKDWICSLGHIWNAVIARRVAGNGCPYCGNRKLLTGLNDLATKSPTVAAEADGWDPSTMLSGSNKKMPWMCHEGHTWNKRVCDRVLGRGCPYCTNKAVWVGFNDLATTNPEIAAQAHGWDPSLVTYGSKKIYEWICDLGHKWLTTPNARTNRSHSQGCPYCAIPCSKILAGFNDLATTHPELAREAYGWDPTQVTRGSMKKLSWKSSACGHVWLSSPNARSSKEAGCPKCNGLGGFDKTKTGYLYMIHQPNWELMQIGITNKGINRLREHRKTGWKLLNIIGPLPGRDIAETEMLLKRWLRSEQIPQGRKPDGSKFDGYTESWPEEELSVSSIYELRQMAGV